MNLKGKFIKKGKSILGAQKPENLSDFLSETESLKDFVAGNFYEIEIDLIKPNPYQPRQYFDPEALSELTESIKQKLSAMGHKISSRVGAFGGYQGIWRLSDPLRYFGASDARKDGCAIGY